MRIEKAVSKDAKALFALEHEVFEAADYPLSLRAFWYHIRKGHVTVTREDGVIVGYILVFGLQKTLKIHSLALKSDYRNQNIALQLVHYVLSLAQSDGFAKCALEVRTDNIAALRPYQKAGFEVSKRLPHFYLDGAEGYYMVQKI